MAARSLKIFKTPWLSTVIPRTVRETRPTRARILRRWFETARENRDRELVCIPVNTRMPFYGSRCTLPFDKSTIKAPAIPRDCRSCSRVNYVETTAQCHSTKPVDWNTPWAKLCQVSATLGSHCRAAERGIECPCNCLGVHLGA